MKEFILMMACLTAMVALSIDAILPALGLISADLMLENRNHAQYMISAVFAGLVLGFGIYGPFSDTIGRRHTLFIGIGIYMIGTVTALLADTLTGMLVGRFLQGLGAASPRTMATAIVRDKFSGREMARITSIIMSIFVLIPAFAPAIGQVILAFGSWHSIFIFYIIYAVLISCWAYFRLEESLSPAKSRPLNARALLTGFKEAASNRVTAGYSICSGLIFSSMLGFLHSAEQIFNDLFDAGERFPLYFGILASCLGAALFANSRLVRTYGMRGISTMALLGASVFALTYIGTLYIWGTYLPSFMILSGLILFCIGLTFGNVSAMAMEPMGHIAGTASAFMGATSMLTSLVIGSSIGQMYNGTLWPVAIGYFSCSVAALALMIFVERGQPTPQEY